MKVSNPKVRFVKLALVSVILLNPLLCFATDMSQQAILQRIKPIGEVNIAKPTQAKLQPLQAPQTQLKKIAKPKKVAQKTAKKIYDSYCAICHTSGVAGAPKLGDTKAWKIRLDQKKLKGLVENVTKGYKMMPPKGTCTECTQKDIVATVKYMLSDSGVKVKGS